VSVSLSLSVSVSLISETGSHCVAQAGLDCWAQLCGFS
jgi:hypothetical protein